MGGGSGGSGAGPGGTRPAGAPAASPASAPTHGAAWSAGTRQYWNADILVIGCGNILFGDDGFGPAVAERLQGCRDLPPNTCVVNAGLAVRDLLFTIALCQSRPGLIVLVDAVDLGCPPGEILERDVDDLPRVPTAALSMHLHPTAALLRELRDGCGVAVKVVSAQVRRVPAEVSPGLSDPVRRAVPAAVQTILGIVQRYALKTQPHVPR
jgi:coenzyme F420 hydrogenase subunit delta